MPDLPAMLTPVGKSEWENFHNFINGNGWIIDQCKTASISSPKLCGGMLVAIPTAIPVDQFINKVGREEGNTEGSVELSL